MALTNCYATLDGLLTELNIGGSDVDPKLDTALNAASRQIDAFVGRRHGFWQDSTVKTREFFADDGCECMVDDISTTTGLIVKTDVNNDGTYAATLTVNTEFILLPVNAADEVPVQPYSCIRTVNSAYFPTWGRPGVQVTAKFGWPAIPDDVTKACLIQATQLFKASAAPFGGVQLGIEGTVIRLAGRMHPLAEALLEPYVKRQ